MRLTDLERANLVGLRRLARFLGLPDKGKRDRIIALIWSRLR